jgi:hypothetical protein
MIGQAPDRRAKMDRRVKPKDGSDKIAIITAGRSRGATTDRLQLLAVCLLSFSIALSDTAPSALQPSIEK